MFLKHNANEILTRIDLHQNVNWLCLKDKVNYPRLPFYFFTNTNLTFWEVPSYYFDSLYLFKYHLISNLRHLKTFVKKIISDECGQFSRLHCTCNTR